MRLRNHEGKLQSPDANRRPSSLSMERGIYLTNRDNIVEDDNGEAPVTSNNEPESASILELPTLSVDPFSKILEGSTNTLISPTDCIPLTRIRDLSKSGILRLALMFDGASPDSGGMCRGHSSSGALPVVLKLTAVH